MRNASSGGWDLVEFAHAAIGNIERGNGILTRGGEDDGLSIGSEGGGNVIARVKGQAGGIAAGGCDGIEVVVAVAV